MSKVLMACGCSSNSIAVPDNAPYCVIHGCSAVAPEQPDLTGRIASCAYCGKETTSSLELAFFEYTPQQSEDTFYCGCRGWS